MYLTFSSTLYLVTYQACTKHTQIITHTERDRSHCHNEKHSLFITFNKMGRLAEMQRKLLEVSGAVTASAWLIALQQMMGPEAMGVANANLVWSDDKVCRNFLCGVCPHTLFTNTVHY